MLKMSMTRTRFFPTASQSVARWPAWVLPGFGLYLSGMPPLVALLFLLSAFAIFVALTRIVAESGVPEARTPMMPQSFVATGIGTTAVGETGITALGFSFTWATELRVVVMASAAHALKLLDGQQGSPPPLLLGADAGGAGQHG